VLLRGKTKPPQDLAYAFLRILDALGNLHFLSSGEQGNLAHLLQIHPHRIVETVRFVARHILFLRQRMNIVHFRLVHDFDIKTAQPGVNGIQLVGR